MASFDLSKSQISAPAFGNKDSIVTTSAISPSYETLLSASSLSELWPSSRMLGEWLRVIEVCGGEIEAGRGLFRARGRDCGVG